MPHCSTCGQHYRLSVYNQTEFCEDCLDEGSTLDDIDSETEVDIMRLTNPSGRTPASFSDKDSDFNY